MSLTEVMSQLEAAGTAQNRKAYSRHGAREPLFGVSWAVLRNMHKVIRVDHPPAQGLWDSGNYDAMILGTMVADPKAATPRALDAWADDVYCYQLADQVADYAAKTALAPELMARWAESDDEWIGRIGWDVLALLAMAKQPLPDTLFEQQLAAIECDIHSRKNFTRHAMNNALIAIGMRNEHLEALAIAAARRIGNVHVDHGQTSCQTPDAESYILRAKARKKR
jgi:3-methyladenine DNA glycosylase AlkD